MWVFVNMGTLINFTRWVLGKTAGAGLILAVGLAAAGLWVYLKDNVNLLDWRREVEQIKANSTR